MNEIAQVTKQQQVASNSGPFVQKFDGFSWLDVSTAGSTCFYRLSSAKNGFASKKTNSACKKILLDQKFSKQVYKLSVIKKLFDTSYIQELPLGVQQESRINIDSGLYRGMDQICILIL